MNDWHAPNDPALYTIGPGPTRCGIHGDVIVDHRCRACDDPDKHSYVGDGTSTCWCGYPMNAHPAGPRGVEPRLPDPESGVLPLN